MRKRQAQNRHRAPRCLGGRPNRATGRTVFDDVNIVAASAALPDASAPRARKWDLADLELLPAATLSSRVRAESYRSTSKLPSEAHQIMDRGDPSAT